MKKEKKVYVVPHSHWDREWYFTIEDSNVLLCENLPYLMNVLEGNSQYKAYVFDGQMSVIEEFLKILPDQKNRLKKLIGEGRIFVGPWYTQTDSLLVNKESIIRNLLYGTRLGTEMGHSMEIGYLPDIFGQNAYLPSIFKGFNIDYSILQRGIYNDDLKEDLNFLWVSPDGEYVKANNIYLGYGPGKFLSSKEDYVQEKLIPMLDKLSSLNTSTERLLLPSGGDQVLIREEFPKTIKELNEMNLGYEFMLSDYESFMKNTWDANSFKNEIHGELIACQKSRIHNTIGSQRYDIKKLNNSVENKIIYILEPLAAISKTLGLEYPKAWLDMIWKLLFDAHAHDSIGGCNSDDTNADIIARLNKANRIADDLLNIIKKKLTFAISKKINKENILVIFNLKITVEDQSFESVLFTNSRNFEIKALSGNIIPFVIKAQSFINGGKQVVVTPEGEKEIELPGYYRTVINYNLKKLPPMRYAVLEIHEKEEAKVNILTKSRDSYISNNHYELKFNEGEVTLINKKNNEVIKGIIAFEECADDGDSYDFSPLLGEEPNLIKKGEIISVEKSKGLERMTIKHALMLPYDLEERKNNRYSMLFKIFTTIELREDEEFVRVSHDIDNNCKDHRVRVLFNTSMKNLEYSYSDEGFSIIKRKNKNAYIENWKEQKFAEAPIAIYPLENFVSVTDEKNTLGVITKGIKEYEVLNNEVLALTLFRSVGLLGKDDLAWRPGRASGINNKVVYTPKAQLLGKLTFEYAIYFNNEKLSAEKLFKASESFIEHYASYQKQRLNTFEERLERFEIPLNHAAINENYSLFSIDNRNIFISTCKESYERDGIIVRLFNPTENKEQTSINMSIPKQLVLCNLYEEEKELIEDKITVIPKGYVTIKIKY